MEMHVTYYCTLQFASNETVPTWWHTFITSVLRNLQETRSHVFFIRFLCDRKNQLIVPLFKFTRFSSLYYLSLRHFRKYKTTEILIFLLNFQR